MDTASHHRRSTGLAVVLLAFALPLAACQTPARSAGTPVAPAQLEQRVAPTPSPLPTPAAPSTNPAEPSPREQCVETATARGVRSPVDLRQLCGFEGRRHTY